MTNDVLIIDKVGPEVTIEISNINSFNKTFLKVSEDDAFYFFQYSIVDGECLFELQGHSYLISISIKKSYFLKFEESSPLQLGKHEICCNAQSKLLELIQNKETGLRKLLLQESLILNLIYYYQKNAESNLQYCNSCLFLNKTIELEKFQIAKEYILSHLDESLTIPIISAYVGTNQCYLKKGFKELFGKTIFDFITENRMTKADFLLKNTNKKIAEIAVVSGYSSSSSFSLAYKNYFGINPGSIQQG
jgi:AraC-like DNA-binding protein